MGTIDQQQNAQSHSVDDPTVVVVGSLNQDLRLPTPSMPRAGETVLGGPHSWGLGGKGSNQAVAAARFGARVDMIGRVGDDEGGRRIAAALAAEGIGCDYLENSAAPTGLATIVLEPSGENRIIVSPGANAELSADQLTRARTAIVSATVVLAQLEIDPAVVLAAFRLATGVTVLNAAPARNLDQALLANTSVLVVNEGELATLAGLAGAESVADTAAIQEACARVDGPESIVVTRGAAGAVIVARPQGKDQTVQAIPAVRVQAIDTTGAGDCFCGVLGAALAQGLTLAEAAAFAVRAASLATTREGAAEAMPSRREVERAAN